MNNIIITFVYILLFFNSCSMRERQFSNEIALLQSKAIRLPSNVLIMRQDTILPKNDINENGYKLVVYVDSVDCTPCAINHIGLWGTFINYTKQTSDQLRFHFIFSPKKRELQNTKLILTNTKFDHPIMLDTLREFEKLNPHLPKNRALHTFLLDENNNVILVGSPLQNRKVKEMFYKIVDEKVGEAQ